MLIQKEANVNTCAVTIPRPADLSRDSNPASGATKWKLKSSVVPAPKATSEPVFKVRHVVCFFYVFKMRHAVSFLFVSEVTPSPGIYSFM